MSDAKKSTQQGDLAARVFVWVVWLAMSMSLVVFFLRDRTNVPLAEDWYIVPALTGHETNFGGWLWSQNNEHRVPLPRLVYFAALKLTGGKFSAVGALNALMLISSAAGLVLFMRSWRRGRTDFADAFFPVLLLNWGHSSHVLFPFLISLVMPVMATIVIGCALCRPESISGTRMALVVSACLVSLPLCGFVGLLYIPTFAAASGYIAWALSKGRRGWPKRTAPAVILAAGVVVATGVSALYFIGYSPPEWNPPSPGTHASFRAGLRVLALGFGVAAEGAWRPFIMLTAVLIVATVGCLWGGLRRGSVMERGRGLGVALFAATSLAFAFAVGWGRAGWEAEFGIPARYALLVAPAFVSCFMVWDALGGPLLRRWVPRALACVLLILVPLNTRAGNTWFADWYRQGMRSLGRDLAAGLSTDELARRHQEFLVHWWTPEVLETHMQYLQEAGIRPFDKAGIKQRK